METERTNFNLLYRIHIELAKDNFLKSIKHYFEEAGLPFEIVKKITNKDWNVYVTVAGIPMRLMNDSEYGNGPGPFKMIFQQYRIILKSFAEFALDPDNKKIFKQKYFYSVEEVVEHFKKYNIVNMFKPNVRSVYRTGVLESFENFKMNEAKNIANLYHYTTIHNLMEILIDDKLNGPTSLTRNKFFHRETKIIPTEVRITLDGNKLSQNYKIKPYSYLHDPFVQSITKGKLTKFENQYEEQTDRDINDFSKYVKEIQIKEIDLWDYLDTKYLSPISQHIGKPAEEISYNDLVDFFKSFENNFDIKIVDHFI